MARQNHGPHAHSDQRSGRSRAAPHPGASGQERILFGLLGGCLGVTLMASAMLRLVGG
jgi:hypothetical protein